jgi:hypothetical protein
MPDHCSKHRAPVAAVSFVLALGGAVIPAEGVAFAQQSAPAPAPEPKKEMSDQVEAPMAIYFAGDVGLDRSALGAFVNELGFDRTAANGGVYGLAGGLRLRDWRFGLRWRVFDTTEFTLWSFAASAGYALPLRPITPIFSAHLGYVFDQQLQTGLFRSSLPEGTILPPNVDAKGMLFGLDVNAAYWVTAFLRVGAFIGFDLMWLHRPEAPLPASLFGTPPDIANKPLYSEAGNGLGFNVNVGIRAAFDIGIQ